MAKTTVTFDGHDLTDLCVCSELVRQFMPRAVGTTEAPGREGAVFMGVSSEPIEIAMRVSIVDRDLESRSDKWRRLAAILAVDGPRPLAISDDGGKYYMAVPHGGDVERFINAETVEIGFTCPEPAMYGSSGTAAVDGSATFVVGGNRPTMPSLSMPAVRGDASGTYTLAVDGEQEFTFAVSPSGSTAAEADCASRTLTVGGTRTLPTLASDWIELAPGEHTAEVTAGTGACTLTWIERWL